MGTWGTGVKQSDEFVEYYEEFFSRFKDGISPAGLADEMWDKYSAEFPDDVPLDADTDILHTVRFALVQCLWECGVNEHHLFDEVDTIIKNNYNLKFWGSENGGDDKLMASRKKALTKFLDKLQGRPGRIKVAAKSTKPRLPSYKKGDVFAYRDMEKGYRVAIILDCIESTCLVAISDGVYPAVPSLDTFMGGQVGILTWMWDKELLPKKERIPLGNVEITSSFNGYAGYLRVEGVGLENTNVGDRTFFYASDFARTRMSANDIGKYIVRDILVPDLLPQHQWSEEFLNAGAVKAAIKKAVKSD